jgi:hypothetical protein
VMTLIARTLEDGDISVNVVKFPDNCPICHFSIEAKYRAVAHLVPGIDATLELVFQCPRRKCQHFFVSRYRENRYLGSAHYDLQVSLPFEPRETEFSHNLKAISPMFCAIANEAQNAEHQGWNLIAGPGYRKALEFLIKDYLCRLQPGEAEKIKQMPLAAAIAKYVDDPRIKSSAERAAWLGNDETHYVRKWEDKDLEDLKKLVQLTMHWIQMRELTESVIKEMPDGKK